MAPNGTSFQPWAVHHGIPGQSIWL